MKSEQLFHVTIEQLHQLQSTQNFPELETARQRRAQLAQAPQTLRVLQQTQHLMDDIELIPQTGYTTYRAFRRSGERGGYETPYFRKRAQLSAASLRLFLGQAALKDVVQDYLWNICEESSWVLPAHEGPPIDLFAAETGFLLAETIQLLNDTLDEEVCLRVRAEIEHRIFDPYLRFYQLHKWYQQASNWNGVCNSAIAATFVLLEPEPARMAQALEIALDGLYAFLDTAFEEDGSSSEGVGYWHYGLINFVALAELLHARSDGAIDLLTSQKMKRIAAFPAKLQLSSSCFASFADCNESVSFHPGIITRLAERTGESSLLNLFAHPAQPDSDWRLSMMLRDIFWWDGSQQDTTHLTDTRLPVGGTAKLVTQTTQGIPLVLSIKAGHNDEQHNHNDIGSFLVHAAGENLLTDPGRGLYSRDYFGVRRYDNIFANSYGHSVPRIDGMLQGTGRAFAGILLEEMTVKDGYKQATIEFAAAYPCSDLKSAQRELRLATTGDAAGTVWLHDHFQFVERAHAVEEAFVTWLECEINGETALLHGQHHDLLLTIEQPQGLQFHMEPLQEQSQANQKTQILKRLSILLPVGTMVDVRICMILHAHALS